MSTTVPFLPLLALNSKIKVAQFEDFTGFWIDAFLLLVKPITLLLVNSTDVKQLRRGLSEENSHYYKARDDATRYMAASGQSTLQHLTDLLEGCSPISHAAQGRKKILNGHTPISIISNLNRKAVHHIVGEKGRVDAFLPLALIHSPRDDTVEKIPVNKRTHYWKAKSKLSGSKYIFYLNL